MFDIASSELLLVALVALLVIGPKDLPRVLRMVGNWVGKARSVANQFRAGFDEMVRQSELEEMEKKWAAENERIMREHPTPVLENTAASAPPREYDSEPPPVMTALAAPVEELPPPPAPKPKPKRARAKAAPK
jgi:sec-independent protein translocase protein TatB